MKISRKTKITLSIFAIVLLIVTSIYLGSVVFGRSPLTATIDYNLGKLNWDRNPQFKVWFELSQTQCRVGEKIYWYPYLVYKSPIPYAPINYYCTATFFFFRVYDSEGNLVPLSYYGGRLLALVVGTMRAGVPISGYGPYRLFILDKAGKYKVEVWAEFSPHFNTGISGYLKVYAEPIWIEVLP